MSENAEDNESSPSEDLLSPGSSQQQKPPFDLEGLITACHIFSPLKELCITLGDIKETGSPRDDLKEVIKALIPFIESIPIQYRDGRPNNLPLNRIVDLVGALYDLDEGKKNTPLFAVDPSKQASNRNTKAGEGVAYDYIIAARRYLLKKPNQSEKAAEALIAKDLRSRGLRWVTKEKIDSWQRHHNNESNRKEGRPDARNIPIDSDERLEIILDRIAHLLSIKID